MGVASSANGRTQALLGQAQALPVPALAPWALGMGREAAFPGQQPGRTRQAGRELSKSAQAQAAWEDEAVCAHEAWEDEAVCAWPLTPPLQRLHFPELCSPRVMNLRAGRPSETRFLSRVCKGNQAQGRVGMGWGGARGQPATSWGVAKSGDDCSEPHAEALLLSPENNVDWCFVTKKDLFGRRKGSSLARADTQAVCTLWPV